MLIRLTIFHEATAVIFHRANRVRNVSRRRPLISVENLEERQLMTADFSATNPQPAVVSTQLPAAVLAQTVSSTNVSDPVVFSGSPGNGATGLNYIWNFGDGSPAVQGIDLKNPSHVFAKPGTFTVSLRFSNAAGDVGAAATVSANVAVKPIPELARWESQMLTYGQKVAESLAPVRSGSHPYSLLGHTFYDSERVFFQIADYTNDPSWLVAANDAETVYREGYVLPNNGGILPWWVFPKGLLMDYQRTGDPASREAIIKMSERAAYAPDTTSPQSTANFSMAREVGHNIMSMLAAEEVGATHRDRLNLLVDQALGHIDQWFVSKTAEFIQPFMVGIISDALIQWYDKTGDPRVLPALKTAMDGVWDTTWDAGTRSFKYLNHDWPTEGAAVPAPDLNLMIAPAFAWIYHQTGDVKYRDRGDLAFAGGVDGSWLIGAKQFNQSYKWSFDFVKWRSEAPLAASAIDNSPDLISYGPQAGPEGSAKLSLGTLTDTNPANGPWTIRVDWGDGTPESSMTTSKLGLIPSIPHTFADEGVYKVTQTLVASNGSVLQVRDFTASLANVAPSATIYRISPSTFKGRTASFNSAGSDPSPADMAAGLVYTWDFGDGSPRVSGLGLRAPSHTYASAGDYTVTLTVTDKDGAESKPTTMIHPVLATPEASATHLGTTPAAWDGTLAGSADGMILAAGTSSLPSYATVKLSGQSSYTWNSASLTDPRAPRAPGASTGKSSIWYASNSFTVELNLTDGKAHRVSLYSVDWDNQGRSQKVEVLDMSGNVLDSRELSSFNGGAYVDFTLKGQVQLRFTKLAGPNAVLNGILFSVPPVVATPAPPIATPDPITVIPPATLLATTFSGWDSVKSNNAEGMILADGTSSLPGYATLAMTGQSVFSWSTNTTDPRALRPPGSTTGKATTWYAASSLTVDLNLTDDQSHRVSLYMVDWDKKGRSQKIEVLDKAGNVVQSRTLASFTGGAYVDFAIKGQVQIRITRVAGNNVVLNGILFGGSVEPPSVVSTPGAATFQATTFSGWDSVKSSNADGMILADGTSRLPSYASVTMMAQSGYSWSSNSTDPRAMRPPGSTTGKAATWYAPDSFTVDLNLTDGKAHRVSLYAFDWDNKGRSQKVEVLDSLGNVIESRTLSSFTSGAYMDFTLSGYVRLRFTRLAGNNAVLGGIIFG